MKIKALINYRDKELNKDIVAGEVYEVTKARGEQILSALYDGKHYAERVDDVVEEAVVKRTTVRRK